MTPRFDRVLATGVGSLPGRDIREALRVVLGELPDLPHLPELPARGPGADMIGRGLGLLVDLDAEWGPRGWEFSGSAGIDYRRGKAWLRQDLDALEELGAGVDGWFKVQVAGPWTLLASTELGSGHRAVRDAGAVRDVVASLAAGVGDHVADIHRRLPAARVLLQLDEPGLPNVLEGSLPSPSGIGRVAAVEESIVLSGLQAIVTEAQADAVVVHCCASSAPVDLFRRAGVDGVSFDLTGLGSTADESIGTAVESGVALLAGVVPSTREGVGPSDVGASVAVVQDLFGRLGLSVHEHDVVVTPTCGLAGADAAYARDAMGRGVAIARSVNDADE